MTRVTTRCSNRGTGLIEALIATAIVVTALGALAALSTLSVRSVLVGRDRTLATAFAQARLDELRSAPGPFAISPADALDREVGGWFEHLDAGGRVLGRDPLAVGCVFGRRWRVQPHPSQAGMFTISVRAGRCVSGTGQGTCGLTGGAVVVAAFRSTVVR
jgi:hypothetical protein